MLPKYKEGDSLIISGNTSDHCFKKGEIVKITKVQFRNRRKIFAYIAENNKGLRSWVDESDFITLIKLNNFRGDIVEVFDEHNNQLGFANKKELLDFCRQCIKAKNESHYIIFNEKPIIINDKLFLLLKNSRFPLNKILSNEQI